MKSLFTYFGHAWTPYFLKKHAKTLSLGSAIGYYLFWSVIFGIFVTIAGVIVAMHYSTFEKISPWFDKVPAFEFVFEKDQLIKTSLPNDPYSIMIENKLIGIVSTTMTLTDIQLGDTQESIYILRDGFFVSQNQGMGGEKVQTVKYSDMKIGDKVINNAFTREFIQEVYPTLRAQVLFVFLPILFFVLLVFITIFHFIWLFIWAGILKIVSFIPGIPRLTYEQLIGFTFYTYFFDIIVTIVVLSIFGMWFSSFAAFFMGSLISLVIFAGNIWFLKK